MLKYINLVGYNINTHALTEKGCNKMAVSYKKLWHILLDRDMKKKDLEMLAGISHYTMSKMSRDENVTTEVLGKVCMALNCKVEDMMEFIPEK